MDFSIERPQVLFLIFAVIPAFLFLTFRFLKLEHSLGKFCDSKSYDKKNVRHSFYSKLFLRCLSWIFAILALSGITFGSTQVPVQKSGCAVSFVFDISFSMNAIDSKNNMSRLEAVKIYSKMLLSKMSDVSVSAVLAKGDGFVAVPLTEDFGMLDSLIDSLSPYLMTSSGSSIGKGIDCAINSFPQNSAKSSFVFVFTDGDETDDELYPSLINASKYQIPVTLIGFGSVDGCEVLAGDGKTKVKTFLMSNVMKTVAENVNKNARKMLWTSDAVRYVDATSPSSAQVLLEQLKSDSESYSFELKPIKRHVLFLAFSLICFILSFIASELNIKYLRKKFGKSSLVLLSFVFVSCSSERSNILEGAWDYYSGKYRNATSNFLKVTTNIQNPTDENRQAYDYASFGLASTYIALEEYDAALDKLNQIIPKMTEDKYDDPKFVSAIFYNEGIIYVRKGDLKMAENLFKKAILADGENLDAKINLELCIQQENSNRQKDGKSEMQGASEGNKTEEDNLERVIFNMIKENEQNQWKKMESKESENNGIDY